MVTPSLFAVVGLGSVVTGVLGGALGVGGGVFMVPFLIFVAAVSAKEAVAVSLCCVIGTSAAASWTAARTGAARLDLALLLEPAFVVGAVAASTAAVRVDDGVVLVGFSGFLLVVVGLMALRRWMTPVADASPLSVARRAALMVAALVSGAASGVFGVGGGVLVVPALALIGRLPLKAAATTSSLALMTSAACGGMVYVAHGLVPPGLVGVALLGVLPGGVLGSRLQRRLPESVLLGTFTVLTLIVAGGSLWRGLRS
jgi:uncharacterized membrane protein YfcA